MDVRFENDDLRRLEADRKFTAKLPPEVVNAFRKRMQLIRGASDERDFRSLKSLHFEKLEGKRHGENSMRLNDRYRLILVLQESADGRKVVLVRTIENYH